MKMLGFFYFLMVTMIVVDGYIIGYRQKRAITASCGTTEILRSPMRGSNGSMFIASAPANSALRWNKNPITYRFDSYTNTLSQAQVREGVRKGFNIWSAVIPLDFTETTGNADIKINFKPLSGNTVGQAIYSYTNNGFIAAEIIFDSEQSWGLRDPRRMDILAVAIHEIGHAIGLQHSQQPGSVMTSSIFSYVDRNGNYLNPQLSQSDISTIQNIYGQRNGGGGNNGGVIVPDATCSDLIASCGSIAHLCFNPDISAFMTQNCKRTCNMCTAVSSCSDSTSMCASYVANGFCSNPFYTLAQRKQFCARSCNLC